MPSYRVACISLRGVAIRVFSQVWDKNYYKLLDSQRMKTLLSSIKVTLLEKIPGLCHHEDSLFVNVWLCFGFSPRLCLCFVGLDWIRVHFIFWKSCLTNNWFINIHLHNMFSKTTHLTNSSLLTKPTTSMPHLSHTKNTNHGNQSSPSH